MLLWIIIIAIIIALVIISKKFSQKRLGNIFVAIVVIVGIIPALAMTIAPRIVNDKEVVAIVETKNTYAIFTSDGNEIDLDKIEDIVWSNKYTKVKVDTDMWLHTRYTLPNTKVIMRYDDPVWRGTDDSVE